MSSDRRRAITAPDYGSYYGSDAERRIIAAIGNVALTGLIEEASGKYIIGLGQEELTGIPSGPKGMVDFLGGFALPRGPRTGNPLAPQHPGGPSKGATMPKIPADEDSYGPNPYGAMGGYMPESGLQPNETPGMPKGGGPDLGGSRFGWGMQGASKGGWNPTDPNMKHPKADRELGIPPKQPVQAPGESADDFEERQIFYEGSMDRYTKKWGEGGHDKGGTATLTERQKAMEYAIKASYQAAYHKTRTIEAIKAEAAASKKEAEKKEAEKKKKSGARPNPEDPGGGGPVGPQVRSRLYDRSLHEAMPTPEGGGPVGPWARTAGRAIGKAEAMPHYEGTGGGGPIGPSARGLSRGVYLPSGREAMPHYEGTGGGGPIGPSSRGSIRAKPV